MEEDIKTLEELLKASKENDMYEGNKYFKSLEYFIKEYQELKEIEESHRKENGELREQVKELEEENPKLKTELKKKDKIIDLIAKELVKAHEWFYSEFDNYTKEDFIKYFEYKVEEEK